MASNDASQSVKKTPFRSSVEDILAGTMGGIAICFVGHPLDTLKVRLQSQSLNNPQYRGLSDCFTQTLKKEGFRGFYKGVGSPLAGMMFFNAAQFLAYGRGKRIVYGDEVPDEHRFTIPQYLAVGAFVGFVLAIIETPMDLFKSQMQVQVFRKKPLYTSVGGCAAHIWRNHGIRGAYQGAVPTFARNTPSVALYFGFYEAGRNAMTPTGETVASLSGLQTFLAGCLGGLAYWTITFPMDVIKTSIQGDHPDRTKRTYSGVFDAARKLYQQGGVRRFYTGYLACMLRSGPANAACLLAYEQTKKLFK